MTTGAGMAEAAPGGHLFEEVTAPAGDDLTKLLAGMRDARVAVAGDFCLDAYWQLDGGPAETSIETGLPVLRVDSQRYSPGGAGNVVANLLALGVGHVRAIGVYGRDPFGEVMVGLLRHLGADTSGMLDVGPEWQTLVYAKPHMGETEQSRLDFGTRDALPPGAAEAVLHSLEEAAGWAQVVVVNQQVRSCFASPEMAALVNALIGGHPGTVFLVDARDLAANYDGAILKLNTREAAELMGDPGPAPASDDDVAGLARRVALRTNRPFFVTRGERGIVAAGPEGVYLARGVDVKGPLDPVGAGDTVVAAIAATLACGAGVPVAAAVANLAASVTVKKLKTTGTAGPGELLAAAAGTDYVYDPDLADNPARARFIPGSEIEVIVAPRRGARPAHAVFDFDGTLSTLREGWEHVMEPMMVRAILGESYPSASTATLQSVRGTVSEFIDRTTGIQTLVQMQGLVDLVRRSGFVPAGDILDEHGYKALYNTEILGVVQRRLAKIEAGHLCREDFQMKGAVAVLEALRGSGVRLYLASGTDVGDVIAEANALGFAEYFEGRIYGSVGDVNVEAKRVVLDRIFRDNGIEPHLLVTFGDGPVEMRETRKRGGTAVGVCSDERRRFGANPAKRRRLVRGGATVLIPDFTDLGPLLGFLGLGTGEGKWK